MKIITRLSLLLNLLLAGGLVFLAVSGHKRPALPAQEEAEVTVPVAASPVPQPVDVQTQSFRWQQLDSGSDYRLFIANLRGIGCPENTIEDIVKGNVSRAFDWERSQHKNDSSGSGQWSEASELAVVNNLLGKPSATSAGISPQGTAGGFAANQQTAQAQVQLGNPAAQTAPNGQNENTWSAENAAQQLNLQFYPWQFQRGNSSASGSVSGGQPATQSQQTSGPGGATQNPGLMQPQNNVPAAADPNNPSSGGNSKTGPDFSAPTDGPPGPPDPLGPNDPYAMSAPDINRQDIINYETWLNQYGSSQPGNGGWGINLGDTPL